MNTAPDKIRCEACPVLCYIRDGALGACDRYANRSGQLVRVDPHVLLERTLESGGKLVPFVERDTPWDGNIFVTAIGAGTMFGGWRIVKTMGQKITKLKPVGGFCAETGGAITLFLATALGIPVSTTHTITGAIVGVGSTQRASAVRWGVAGNIVWAWIFTIPASAFVAAVAYWISLQIF